jgi:arsenate reductase
MAAAFVNRMCAGEFEAQSAGLEPGRLNPVVVEVLREIGIDIAGNRTQSVDEVVLTGQTFAYVVTVCSEAEAEGCPYFPGGANRLHWPFPDPSKLTGSHAEKLARVREIRDEIERKVEAFCEEQCAVSA